jgi:hypothetical protein
MGGLGSCYTWKRQCYPVPDPCGVIQNIRGPIPCPPTVTWFWIGAAVIALAAIATSTSRGSR